MSDRRTPTKEVKPSSPKPHGSQLARNEPALTIRPLGETLYTNAEVAL
jgi:hypothetical protein